MMKQHLPSQKGLVSITLTFIMIVVISLIVLGFAQVSRREQSQALDRQLSSQAFFAAESGVNSAIEVIRKAPAGSNIEKSNCGNGGNALYNAVKTEVGPAGGGVAVTCLLVKAAGLTNLRASVPADGQSRTFPLKPDATVMDRLHIDWKPESNVTVTTATLNNCPTSTANLTQTSAWNCPYGVLRLDIVPLSAFNRNALTAGQRTIFLYPVRSAAGVAVSPLNSDGQTRAMYCTTAGCRADLTGMNIASNYMMRAMAVYRPGTIDVSADRVGGGAPVVLREAQAQIDVTGKAQDVLRRIQVRISLGGDTTDANYSIQSASSICKHYSVGRNIFRNNGITGQDQNNPLCRAASTGP